jgi:multiple sugar transport system permease protein
LFILPWVLGMVIFTAGPMILSLLMSFADWDIIRPARFRGAGNYVEAFTIDPTFWKSLQVTLLYTVFSVPLGIMMSLALAMLLNTKVKGIALWRTCYYIPAMASPIATSLIWIKLFQPEGGLLNAMIFGPNGQGGIPILRDILMPFTGSNGQINWLQNEQVALPSLILMSIFGAGGGMVILLAALQGVPQYYYEAATLDGAGPAKKFRAVTVPLISPALFFTLITGFIGSFQVFTQAFQMTQGGPNNATMFFMLLTYNNAFRTLRMGYASSLAWVLFVVVLIFTVIQLQGNKLVYYEGSDR